MGIVIFLLLNQILSPKGDSNIKDLEAQRTKLRAISLKTKNETCSNLLYYLKVRNYFFLIYFKFVLKRKKSIGKILITFFFSFSFYHY